MMKVSSVSNWHCMENPSNTFFPSPTFTNFKENVHWIRFFNALRLFGSQECFQKTQEIVTKFGNEKSKLTYSNLSNVSFTLIILKIIKVFSLNNFWYILHDVLGLKYASNFSFQGSFFWLQGALIPWSLSQVQVLN